MNQICKGINDMQWKEATLQQLLQIIRFEDCPLIFKCFAESELERRLNSE